MDGLENRTMGSKRADLTAPCKGCGERKPGCHDRCEGYAAFRAVLGQARSYEAENSSHVLWDPMAPKRRRDL